MFDIERIGKIISDIERFLSDLDSMEIKNVDDLRDRKTFYASSMLIFAILNRVIDLGEELILAYGLGIPKTYRAIFKELGKAGIIDKNLQTVLESLVFYRNAIAHEYYDIDEEEIFEVINSLDAVRRFVKRVKEILQP